MHRIIIVDKSFFVHIFLLMPGLLIGDDGQVPGDQVHSADTIMLIFIVLFDLSIILL